MTRHNKSEPVKRSTESISPGDIALRALPFLGFFAMFTIPFLMIAAAGEGESRVILGTAIALYALMVLMVVVPNYVLWKRRQDK